MTTLHDIYQDTKRDFHAGQLDTPDLDARILVLSATGMKREDLVLKAKFEITSEQEQKIDTYKQRRLQGEPVSRILGTREFFGLDFMLSEKTLDPRPDTETLVETVLKHLPDAKDKTEKPLRILDLGTGTGCIALSLLKERPHAEALALDISEDAITTARQNAQQLGLSARADFQVLDWKQTGALKQQGVFDVIVSNPPYIRSMDIETLSLEVKGFDPHAALDGGVDGLDCYREIMSVVPDMLHNGGLLAVEIGYDQAEDVVTLFREAGFPQAHVEKDLAGHDRCIFAIKKT